MKKLIIASIVAAATALLVSAIAHAKKVNNTAVDEDDEDFDDFDECFNGNNEGDIDIDVQINSTPVNETEAENESFDFEN